MILKHINALCLALALSVSPKASAADPIVDNVTDLVAAVENARPGTAIRIATGIYRLAKPLELRPPTR
jgi:hypothetical protein